MRYLFFDIECCNGRNICEFGYVITDDKFIKVLKEKINPENKHDTMIFGTVKSVDPIQIEIYNGLILEEGQLFLGQMCRPYKVKIPHTHIVDTHFSEKSTSIGTHAGGLVFNNHLRMKLSVV